MRQFSLAIGGADASIRAKLNKNWVHSINKGRKDAGTPDRE